MFRHASCGFAMRFSDRLCHPGIESIHPCASANHFHVPSVTEMLFAFGLGDK